MKSDFLPVRINSSALILLIVSGICAHVPDALVADANAAQPYFLVSDYSSGKILRYGVDGSFLGDFATGVGGPSVMDIGPDGHLYVVSVAVPAILRFDLSSGQQISSVMKPGAYPRGYTWSPNGDLLVAQGGGGVDQFDGNTGSYVGQFANLINSTACQFDGDLFVTFGELSTPAGIKQFDGTTGELISTFATDLLNMPTDLLLAPNGDFYVSNQGPGPVIPILRVNRQTGMLDPAFSPSTSFFNPVQLSFSPTGDLLVVDGASTIIRLDPVSGTFLGNLISDPTRLSSVAGIVYINVPEPSAPILLMMCVVLMQFSRIRLLAS